MITITTVNAKAQDLIEYFKLAGLTDYIPDQQEYFTSFSFIITDLELTDLEYLAIDNLGSGFKAPITIHTNWKYWRYGYNFKSVLVLSTGQQTPIDDATAHWKRETEIYSKMQLAHLIGAKLEDVCPTST